MAHLFLIVSCNNDHVIMHLLPTNRSISRSPDVNSWILASKIVKKIIVVKPVLVLVVGFKSPLLKTKYLEVWVVICKGS